MFRVPYSAAGPLRRESEPGREGARSDGASPAAIHPGTARSGGARARRGDEWAIDVWDQDAALATLVAAVESGEREVPPDDDEAADAAWGCPPEYAGVCLREARAPGLLPWDAPGGRVGDGSAGGFASGGVFDTALPGPVLATFADEVTGPEGRCPGTTDDELIGLLRAWQRQESWSAARRLAVTAELIRRRPAPGCPAGQDAPEAMPSGWTTFCADELAAATACSRRAAEKTLAFARDLATRLTATARALHEGAIDLHKARIISDATRTLDDREAAAAETLALRGAAAKTAGQLRAAIGRAVVSVNPDAARARRERAERDARVELWREDAGTAALCGRDLPPAEALAADQRITAYARDLKAAGVEGSMDQLRARAFLDLALGITTRPGRPATSDGAIRSDAGPGGPGARTDGPDARANDADPRADGPGPAADSGGHAEPHVSGAGSAAAPPRPGGPGGLAARINLTVPLATLLGLADRPGEAAGLGAIDPGLARALATAAAQDPRTGWCVTVTDQDGHPTAHGCARRARTARRRGSDPDGPPASGPPRAGPSPTGPPPDVPDPPPAEDAGGPGGFGFSPARGQGPPGGQNGGHGRWRLRIPGSSAPASGRNAGPGSPARPETGTVLDVDLAPLAIVDCDHRDQCDGYRPSDRLRHLVQIRDGECTWPPCRRAAQSSDFEHAIPYDQGGRTCLCNTGARCRHHHQAKQAAGWQVAQHLPGYHTWTTPAGRRYTTGPTRYPV